MPEGLWVQRQRDPATNRRAVATSGEPGESGGGATGRPSNREAGGAQPLTSLRQRWPLTSLYQRWPLTSLYQR
jgi:hypothetical protein